ncbi:carbohydrate kinase family protein [Variovorax fucosicus]|uniref:carbohydrate kinase family protein n=1 Tax=Variovorax fucosicus TaxID=3053517 RepID=UPI002578F3BB|nr:carbohydrate kinase [Variovorax sp. J22G47]MDM0058059.1 carbohydrate kinase [Variovorax sp. J22G47]
MFVVCGEALMDVYMGESTPVGMLLDARIGGSPLNVAQGLARLERPVAFLCGLSTDALGERLFASLQAERVDTSLLLRSDAPSTLSVVSVDAGGVPRYAFHGNGAADRQLTPANLPALPPATRVLQFGSYALAVEPVGSTLRALAARERERCLIAYDPNVRLNVEPDLAHWREVVELMASLAHLVKVSDEDLGLLYPAETPEQVAARWLAGGTALVAITRGSKGSSAWTAAAQADAPAQPVQVIDTVGAGDTFQAALLTWLDEHDALTPAALAALDARQLEALLRFATQAAAITCSRRGANMPRRAELPR